MFGKWLIDGHIDAVFRLAAGILNELLKRSHGTRVRSGSWRRW